MLILLSSAFRIISSIGTIVLSELVSPSVNNTINFESESLSKAIKSTPERIASLIAVPPPNPLNLLGGVMYFLISFISRELTILLFF